MYIKQMLVKRFDDLCCKVTTEVFLRIGLAMTEKCGYLPKPLVHGIKHVIQMKVKSLRC